MNAIRKASALAAVAFAFSFAAGCEDNKNLSTTKDRDRDGIADAYDHPDRPDQPRDEATVTRDRHDVARDDDAVVVRERTRVADQPVVVRERPGVTTTGEPVVVRETTKGEPVVVRERVIRDSDLRGLADLPKDAVRVDQGRARLHYTADRDGHIYLFDENDDRVIYSGKIQKGQDFIVEPDREVMLLNGKSFDDVRLRSGDHYRVYFLRD